MADASTKDLVSAQLVSEHEAANRHWEELCKMQDLDEQAEQVRVCVRVRACVGGWMSVGVRTQNVCTYVRTYVRTSVHTYTQVQYMDSVTCKLTCTYVRTYVRKYVHWAVCMYVCTY